IFLDTLGRRLPPITQSLLDVSAFLQTYGLQILAGLFGLTGAVVALYLWPPTRLRMDRLLLRLPVVGGLVRLAATVQVAHGLGVMLQSGIPLVEALRTLEGLVRNRFLAGRVG